MKSAFYIQCNIQTAGGPESYGRFELGNDRKAAVRIFRQLKGSAQVAESNFLSLELMEMSNGLPLNMQLISCTLDELACNCRIIAKELFHLVNLEGQGPQEGRSA